MSAGVIAERARVVELLAGAERHNTSHEGRTISDAWDAIDSLPADTLFLGSATVVTWLTDASSRLNITMASETEVSRLLDAIGFQPGERQVLLHAILADRQSFFKDASAVARRNDTEASVVLRRDAERTEIQSREDMAEESAITHEMLRQLLPYLTIRGSGRINVRTAPNAVLATLPGFTAEIIEEIDRSRRAGVRLDRLDDLRQRVSFGARAAFDEFGSQLSARLLFRTDEVEAHVDAKLRDGLHRESSVILRRGNGAVTVEVISND